ncbi:hypothetical protein [Dyadobacter sp. 676]|uniref:Uncharacterized protein n=1 Tax=Dyadobacter sp. 676 TaxID=3088362 RepID=A0AAU8FLX3_9BACT
MKPKIKILLHSLMRDVSRGISTPEKAADEFKKATGQNLEDVLDQADPKVGEFLAFLVGAYKIQNVHAPQVDLAALREGFLETDPTTPVESPADPQEDQEPEAPVHPFTEVVPVATETTAPAVPVDQPKRTRKTGKKPA